METIIEVNKLSKKFGEIAVVDNISFAVRKGEVHGFLGQNGAGKSTTIRMLLTLIKPTSGSIKIFGQELTSNRNNILRNVGAIIEKPDLYKYLTANKNLEIISRLSSFKPDKNKIKIALDKVGLLGRGEDKVKTFSQGMKQRLGIACALIHDPRLIILDEPTNGLDPQGIADIRNLILHLSRNEGKTVFVSSHLLSEMQLIADSMLIIDKGKVVADGKASELLNPSDMMVVFDTTNNKDARKILRGSQWNQHIINNEDQITLKMDRNKIPELTAYLVNNNIGVVAIRPKHSLEDYFLSLTTGNQHVATYKD